MRYITKKFSDKQDETIGAGFHQIRILLPTGLVNLQVWDTAGQERYKSLGPIYYHGAQAGIFVYDSSNLQTFNNIESWLRVFYETVGKNIPCMLIGNKADIEANQVPVQNAIEFANLHNMTFMEASAKTGFNIENIFYAVALNFQYDNLSKEGLIVEEKKKSCSCSI